MERDPGEGRSSDGLSAADSQEPILTDEPAADLAGRPQYQPLWVRLACIVIDFFTQVYDQIRIVPEIALFLRSICSTYYGTPAPPAPPACKILPVQKQLADLRSWKAFFDGVAIFATAIPMGILADKYGRKKVIASSIFGPIAATTWVVLIGYDAFGWGNIKLIWLSSIFFGFGNLSAANATIYAMAADSCPPSKRSQYFYYLYSTFLVCELFAPALASVTIDKNLLIPFGIGLAALVLCYPILAVMPETHNPAASKRSGPLSRGKMVAHEIGAEGEGEAEALLPAARDAAASPGPHEDQPSFRTVLQSRNLLLALVVIFVGAFRQATVSVLLQYAAARFDWPIARTAMLISGIAAMNIVLFLLFLPQCIAFLTAEWNIPSQIIDYNIVSVSLVILCLGSLLMGLAPSTHFLVPAVLLFAAGYGTRVAVLSLITIWTPDDIRARTFSIAQIVENVGRMSADPLLLRILGSSLRLDGIWPGMPFFVASAGFGIGAVAWRFVKLDPKHNRPR